MKFKIQNILNAILILVIASSIAFAGPRSKRGLSAAPELLIPVGSIGTALSGSVLANASGVDAIYWNPAGLDKLNGKMGEVMFSHQRYIADIDINYLSAGYRIGGIGTLGLSVKSLGFGDIPITTTESPDGTGDFYSPTYLTIGLTYSRAMTDRIYFGATAKVISERIVNETSTGFAFDFGLQYIVGTTGLKFGVALKNIGQSMKFDGPDLEAYYQPSGTPVGSNNEPRRVTLAEFDLPTSLALGLSYDLNLGKKTNSMVTFSGTFQNNSFSADDFAVGLEYNFKQMVFLRGAFNFDQDFLDDKNIRDDRLWGPTFGAGFRYNFGSMFVSLDYAYRMVRQDFFDANQYFTVNLGF
jgi:long-subunit fatty acid transport protein